MCVCVCTFVPFRLRLAFGPRALGPLRAGQVHERQLGAKRGGAASRTTTVEKIKKTDRVNPKTQSTRKIKVKGCA